MNRQDINLLRSEEQYPSVSIFVRTHRTMPERERDPIVVKNLVKEAKERLLVEFASKDLTNLFDRLDAAVAKIDYARSKDGIAIFINKNVEKIFRLPFPVESRVIIDKTFALGEIDRIAHRMLQYWLVSLHDKSVRLYSGIGKILHEVTDAQFPLQYERPFVDSKEYVATNEMIVHPVQDSEYFDEHKRQFMRTVVQASKNVLKTQPLPLIVIGLERNVGFFNEIDPLLAQASVIGDVEKLSIFELADRIEQELRTLWKQKQQKKMADFDRAIGTLHHAFGIQAVWRAAQEGRVKDLLVEEGYSVAGAINQGDPKNIMLADNPSLPKISDDLVDSLVASVSKQGGSITFFAPGMLKEYEQIAAILRY